MAAHIRYPSDMVIRPTSRYDALPESMRATTRADGTVRLSDGAASQPAGGAVTNRPTATHDQARETIAYGHYVRGAA